MSVTAVPGFVAAGTACGVKASGADDLAMVATADGSPVIAAGVFTSNKMTAPPVLVTRKHLAATDGRAAAVVLNSGNANAATGAAGMADAEMMCVLTAEAIGCTPDEVLVCSTGLIGFPLPMDRIVSAIPTLAGELTDDGGPAAARAIMTTDTVPRTTTVTGTTLDGGTFTIGGVAKGAAMLEPNMATMLAVLTTDALLDAPAATELLRAAVGVSFNCLTVDGAESTNDTVLLLASGTAGPVATDEIGLARFPHAGADLHDLIDAIDRHLKYGYADKLGTGKNRRGDKRRRRIVRGSIRFVIGEEDGVCGEHGVV